MLQNVAKWCKMLQMFQNVPKSGKMFQIVPGMYKVESKTKGFLMVQNFTLSDQNIVKKKIFLYHCHF